MDSFIQDFGILLMVIVVISYLIKLIKQPIIIGYVLSGFAFSFLIPDNSPSGEQIITLSELGITFLLFLMGLEFDLKNLKFLGKDLFIVTTLQTFAFLAFSLILNYFFGFSMIENIYLSILFIFSSTLLVAKWIEDKKETGSLYGKVVLGILIIQDVLAIIALTVISMLKETDVIKILMIPVGAVALFVAAFFFTKYILNPLVKYTVRYPELMFIFSLGVCFMFVEIAPLVGYSMTIGAFIAGVCLANTEYKNDIYSKLKPLIIFFNMLFFVGLGYMLTIDLSIKTIIYILVICGVCLAGKPLIVYLTLKLRGYDIKSSFISGLNLAQFSEFGIIIVTAGIFSKAIPEEIGSIAIISVILTMILSSYLIKYDKKIFKFVEKPLMVIDKLFMGMAKMKVDKINLHEYNIIFFGYYDLSKDIFSKLEGMGAKILVIENDPANIELLKESKINYVYNSVTNPYFFNDLDFRKINLIVSNLIDFDDNIMIIKRLKKDNPSAHVIVTAKSLKDSLKLYDNDADYVIYPTFVNEQQVSVLLEDYTTDINKVLSKKIADIAKLKEKEEKQEHFIEIDSYLKKITQIKKPEKKEKDMGQNKLV